MTREEKILDNIEKLKVESEECERRNYDKLQYSNPYSKEISRLLVELELIRLPYDLTVKHYGAGMYIINDKFIVAPRSYKWRVKGKNKWYYFKTPTQLVEKYILKF